MADSSTSSPVTDAPSGGPLACEAEQNAEAKTDGCQMAGYQARSLAVYPYANLQMLEYATMNAPVIASGTLIANLLRDLKRPHHLDFTANELLPQMGLLYPSDQMWSDFRHAMGEEETTEELKRQREWLASALRQKAISNWVAQNVEATDSAKHEVTTEVESLFRRQHYDDLQEYLSDVLEHGPAKARSKRRHRTAMILSAVWIVLTGIARLAVAFAIFGIAQTTFETVSFSLLLLIYAAIQASAAWNESVVQMFQAATSRQLFRIRRLLKDDIEPSEQESEKETSEITRHAPLYLLRALSVSLMWLLAIGKLVLAVFF